MAQLRWDPKVVDLSPGLAALSDAVDVTNAAKQRRREADRQKLRDEAADRYNQGQLDNLARDNARADKKVADDDKENEDKTKLAIVNELNKGPGGLAAARALALQIGGNIDEGQSEAMPKLQLDDPTTGQPSPSATGGLAGMFKLRNPTEPEPMAPPPDAPDVGYAKPPGLAGLLGGKKLSVDPSISPNAGIDTQVKAADWSDKTREWDKAETANPLRAGMYMLRDRDGKEVKVDPEAGRTADAVKREDAADKWLGSARETFDPNDPDMARAAKITRDNIASGEASPGQGMQFFQSEYQRLQGQRSREKESEADRLSREKIAGMRKHGGGAGGGKPITPDQKLDNDRQNASLADNMLNQHLSREEYKDTRKDLADTKTLLTGLESKNVAAQRAALGVWAKNAAGPGTVQQSERDEFVNSVGGKDMAVRKKALEWLSGGEVPEEQLKIFSAAARDISMRQQMERLGAIQDDVRDMFASHPNDTMRLYADWAANRVGRQYMPHGSGGGSAPQGATSTTPAAAGGGQKEKLLEYARRNPGDPRSKAIIQKFGGA